MRDRRLWTATRYKVRRSIYRSGKLRCENSKLSSRRDQAAHGEGAHDEKRTQSHGFLALTPTIATKTIAMISRDKRVHRIDPLQPWNADRVVILVGQHFAGLVGTFASWCWTSTRTSEPVWQRVGGDFGGGREGGEER